MYSERPIPNLKELSAILGKYFCFCSSLPPSEIAIGAMIYDPTYEIGAGGTGGTGNNNGLADYNEFINLDVDFQNIGTVNSQNINVVICFS